MKDTKLREQATLSRQEVRCECGCLVAKLMESGVELKCRRCKRLAVIPFAQFKGESRTTTVSILKTQKRPEVL